MEFIWTMDMFVLRYMKLTSRSWEEYKMEDWFTLINKSSKGKSSTPRGKVGTGRQRPQITPILSLYT